MPPNTKNMPPSSLGINPPPRRAKNQTVEMWLEDKGQVDNAEGLWRVNDGIYDLSEFINKHPGGSEWLQLSKGLDITEAFEVHHFSKLPSEMLKKYFVRSTKIKRNSPYTFKEDGFYKTLKREIIEVLPTIAKQSTKTTDFFIDALLVILFFLSILAVKYWNFFLGILAGNALGFLSIAAHNYLHQKDNFRMYYFNFSLQTVREWRISHVYSHHLYTNTIHDYEISFWEPFLQYLPIEKSPLRKYAQWVIAPVLWPTGFHRAFFNRVVEYIQGRRDHVKKTDLIPFSLPLFMYITGGQSLGATFLMWTFIVMIGSAHLFFVALHAGHHHPEVFHDGDHPRSQDDYDWGFSQVDAVLERKDINGSHFLVLTSFGDHALHHLFPTLDHGILEHLYPAFKKVLEQFDSNLRIVSQTSAIYGGFQQLIRVTPNPSLPDLKKYDMNKYL